MTVDPLVMARRWAEQLPTASARQLAQALREGPSAIRRLREQFSLPGSLAALTVASEIQSVGDGAFAAGALLARLDAAAEQPLVTPVWTGPESAAATERLTLAVVADLVEEAEREIFLVSFAALPGAAVREALARAAVRGVAITMLLERSVDSPTFDGPAEPFPGLAARRLCWPGKLRPPGASMHAKILVVDRRTALIGSANLTGHALERNLEAGVLVRGGGLPASLVDHLMSTPDLRAVD